VLSTTTTKKGTSQSHTHTHTHTHTPMSGKSLGAHRGTKQLPRHPRNPRNPRNPSHPPAADLSSNCTISPLAACPINTPSTPPHISPHTTPSTIQGGRCRTLIPVGVEGWHATPHNYSSTYQPDEAQPPPPPPPHHHHRNLNTQLPRIQHHHHCNCSTLPARRFWVCTQMQHGTHSPHCKPLQVS